MSSHFSHLFQSNFAGIFEVRTLPLKVLVRFVSNDKNDICWNFIRGLISLPLEGYLSSRFPAGLDVDGENFLLLLGSSVIGEDSP